MSLSSQRRSSLLGATRKLRCHSDPRGLPSVLDSSPPKTGSRQSTGQTRIPFCTFSNWCAQWPEGKHLSKVARGDAHQRRAVVVNLLHISFPDIQRAPANDALPLLELLLQAVLEEITNIRGGGSVSTFAFLFLVLGKLSLWINNVLELAEVLGANASLTARGVRLELLCQMTKADQARVPGHGETLSKFLQCFKWNHGQVGINAEAHIDWNLHGLSMLAFLLLGSITDLLCILFLLTILPCLRGGLLSLIPKAVLTVPISGSSRAPASRMRSFQPSASISSALTRYAFGTESSSSGSSALSQNHFPGLSASPCPHKCSCPSRTLLTWLSQGHAQVFQIFLSVHHPAQHQLKAILHPFSCRHVHTCPRTGPDAFPMWKDTEVSTGMLFVISSLGRFMDM